jgi:hypothetical protein
MQECFEIMIGYMTMDKYEKIFTDLLRYVDFIKHEKVRIYRFLSGFSSFYKDKIQFGYLIIF